MSESDVSWWDWVQRTKDKVVSQSSEVLEFVKKDIEEFSKVVTDEASGVVSSTATTIKEKLQLDDKSSSANQVKKSVSGFLSHVAEVFTPSPDDDDQEAILIWNQQPVVLDRLQAAKYAFCSNPSNFLKEPENEDLYETWLQSFSIESHENELPNLLLDNIVLGTCYSTLVPAQISHTVFWHRYFYEVQRLEKAEEKRKEMRKRAETSNQDFAIVWEDEDDFAEKIDITEQMQSQLLENYEKEIQEMGNTTADRHEPMEGQYCGQTTNIVAEQNENSSPSKSQRSSKSSTPSSKDTEEEWEKVEPEPLVAETDKKKDSVDTNKENEDWENWQ